MGTVALCKCWEKRNCEPRLKQAGLVADETKAYDAGCIGMRPRQNLSDTLCLILFRQMGDSAERAS